jgi:hypothetical protein
MDPSGGIFRTLCGASDRPTEVSDDEFVLLLAATDRAGAEEVAERVRAPIGAARLGRSR